MQLLGAIVVLFCLGQTAARENYVLKAANLKFPVGTALQEVLSQCEQYTPSYQFDIVRPGTTYDPESSLVDKIILRLDADERITTEPIILTYAPNVKKLKSLIGKDYAEVQSSLEKTYPSEKVHSAKGSPPGNPSGRGIPKGFLVQADDRGKVVAVDYRYPFLYPVQGKCYEL